jgi:hypothetical protein
VATAGTGVSTILSHEKNQFVLVSYVLSPLCKILIFNQHPFLVTFVFTLFDFLKKMDSFSRRSSAAKLPGQPWSVLDLPYEVYSLVTSEEDEAFITRVMANWETRSFEDITHLHDLFCIHQEVFHITWHNERELLVHDKQDHGIISLFPFMTEGYYNTPYCALMKEEVLGALKPAHIVAAEGWNDPTRLARCLAHWDDRALVSEEDVAWCMRRNDVPRECYMRVAPGWPNKFLVGTELQFFKTVLDPFAHSPRLVAMHK